MRSKAFIPGLAFILVFSFFTAAMAAQDYSADMLTTTKGGSTIKAKIFAAKDRIRVEMPQAITITRMDKKVVWILMPKEKQYMEQALDMSTAASATDKVPGEIERKLIGQEMVGGKAASKYRITYKYNGRKDTIFQWLTAGLSIPVKTAAVDGMWSTEMRNIKMGRQADSLFELPAGYQKFSQQTPSFGGMLKDAIADRF